MKTSGSAQGEIDGIHTTIVALDSVYDPVRWM
jgi:hypothetical protein